MKLKNVLSLSLALILTATSVPPVFAITPDTVPTLNGPSSTDNTPINLNNVFKQAPYVIPASKDFVSTLTGSLFMTKEDLVLPGVNGFKFTLKRNYDSYSAQLFDQKTENGGVTFEAKTKPDIQSSFLGPGWRWELPFIDKYDIHLPGGDTYTASSVSPVDGYPYKDITLLDDYTFTDSDRKLVMMSEGRNYFFDNTGKVKHITDQNTNEVTFTYAATPLDCFTFQPVAMGAVNAGTPITKIQSGGNSITFEYIPAGTDVDGSQKVVVKSGTRTLYYRFTQTPVELSPTASQTVPLLSEVELTPTIKTQYKYAMKDAWHQTYAGSFGNFNTLSPYALITSVTHPTGDVTNYQYTEMATLVSGVSSNDVYRIKDVSDSVTEGDKKSTYNHMSFSYFGDLTRQYTDGTFRMVAADDLGRKTIYTYKKDSKMQRPFYKKVSQREERGDTVKTTTYAYDETNKYPDPIQIKEVNTSKSNPNLASKPKSTTRSYDEYGSVISETLPNGAYKEYKYDTYLNRDGYAYMHALSFKKEAVSGNPNDAANPVKFKTTVYYRTLPSGNVSDVRVLDTSDATIEWTKYQYDSFGNVLKLEEINSGNTKSTTNYTYANGYLTEKNQSVANVDGLVSTIKESYLYDPKTGQLKQLTDGNGNIITYEYDPLNRIAKVNNPDKTGTSVLYDDVKNTIEMDTLDATGTTVKRDLTKWNPLGWKTETGHYEGTSYQRDSLSEYDAYGRTVINRDAKDQADTMTYDLSDRILTMTHTDGSQIKYDYDDINSTKTTTDEDGHASRETYDFDEHVVRTESMQPSGPVTTSRTEYDTFGNIVRSTDGNSNTTEYQYNLLSKLIGVKAPDGSQVTYEYDMHGNLTLTKFNDPSNSVITKTYDQRNRLVKKVDEQNQTVKYYYDGNNNLIKQIEKEDKILNFEYDSQNRLTKKVAGTDTITYEYNAKGLRSKMVDQTGTTQYSYRDDNKLVLVQLPDGKSISYTYDAAGNRTSMVDPFGRKIAYTNDSRNRMQSVSFDSPSNPKEAAYLYTNSNKVKKTTLGNGLVSSYEYDAKNQLTSLLQLKPDGSQLNLFQYGYDGDGNQNSITENGTPTQLTYDKMNRVATSSQRNETYQYDFRSNRTVMKTDMQLTVPTNTYEYDLWNHLTKATTLSGVVSYKYDGDGLLYERTEAGVTTRYYYNDQQQVIATAAISGGAPVFVDRFIRGSFGQLALREDSSGTKSYYQHNGHGDVIALLDTNGTTLNTYTYDIWGNLQTNTGTANNPFRYAGEFYDSTSGLIYLRARWYDPAIGRFITEDTYEGQVDSVMSLNLYTYVKNSPIKFIDPSGHRDQLDEGGASGGGGILSSVAMILEKVASWSWRSSIITSWAVNAEKAEEHIFSDKHIKKGLMELGSSRLDILEKAFSKINAHQSRLVEGTNSIMTHMNGYEATVRVHIQDGVVLSVNLFKGWSGRQGNIIEAFW